MKFRLIILMCVVVLSVSTIVSGAAEEKKSSVEVGNKICPVSGDKVGDMGEVVQLEYQGKIYNFCCKSCLKDFNEDPDKYVKKVEEEMADEAKTSEESSVKDDTTTSASGTDDAGSGENSSGTNQK